MGNSDDTLKTLENTHSTPALNELFREQLESLLSLQLLPPGLKKALVIVSEQVKEEHAQQ